MEYDLIRLFEHPLKFRGPLVHAITVLGGGGTGRRDIGVTWRTAASAEEARGTLTLTWDVAALRPYFADIEDELVIARTRDRDRATQVENAAAVVAVAVLAHVEPGTTFSERSREGTGHDFYLNDTADEMIEVAGRWEDGLPDLFADKKWQSDRNARIRKRWVSVTIFHKAARNRTEGLHP